MLAAIVAAALAIDGLFSALGLIPESRPSIESITDRGISLNYTAVLNAIFTVVGGLLLWLTISRGATDPVYGMRVDRYATQHTVDHLNRTYFLCSAGCRSEFEAAPERYAQDVHARRGVATEAATMACATAASRFGISRMIALVHPEHVASRRVAEHLGMRAERTALLDGDYPAVVYAAELPGRPS